ncbi:peptide deformylase [Micromonospora costi]|uniref:peptide deformylase n=1 Tax=Micromonospora costi TaxID=1530042 RepID=UPI00131A08C7|nr:peptide deformylase [Micromonospora costi]
MSGRTTRKAQPAPGRRAATCDVRGDGRRCAPLNEIVVRDPGSGAVEAYAACSCGRRYPLPWTTRARLLAFLPGAGLVTRGSGTIAATALDQLVSRTVWPADSDRRFAKRGVVPVGTPVLHEPTAPAPLITTGLVTLALHMSSVMRQARGIGLAGNQVGVPVRVLVHKLGTVAPETLVNPELLRSSGTWEYTEGCLSLDVPETAARVLRPRTVLVRAAGIDGRALVMMADELFARVLQHEIDHLDGVEYVQRLTGPERARVYQVMRDQGVDVAVMPPRPYGGPAPR